MSALVDALSWTCIALGALAGVSAGVGLLRFPDFYTRVHAGGVGDTAGAGFVLIGLALQAGWSQNALKLLLILGFLWLSSATSAHALVAAARYRGLEPLLDPDPDEAGSAPQGDDG